MDDQGGGSNQYKFSLFSNCIKKFSEARKNLHVNVNNALKTQKDILNRIADEGPVEGCSTTEAIINTRSRKRCAAPILHDFDLNSVETVSVSSDEDIDGIPLVLRTQSSTPRRSSGRGRRQTARRGRGRGRARRGNRNRIRNLPEPVDFITIGDDEEQEMPPGQNEVLVCDEADDSLNISELENEVYNKVTPINSEIPVKVQWMAGEILRIYLRRHQKFAAIFRHISEVKNVPEDQILLVLRDSIYLTPNDTPDSVQLSIIDIIEGGITSRKVDHSEALRETAVHKDDLEFKLLLKDRRKPLLVFIRKTDKMKLLMIKCAEELEVPVDTLKFVFDGEELDGESTPEELDLEGGEMIDVKFRN